jgi:HPt (histidine-containing phosphotransfer) domain-containing protein
MTAHALEGDRERCLAAGMDHYLAKPIDQRKMFDVVEACGAHSPPPGAVTAIRRPEMDSFDAAVVLKRVDGDRKLLKEVAELFMEDTPRLLSEIRAAIVRTDDKALKRAAHTLRGSVGNFGAKRAIDATSQLEELGRRGDFAHAEEIASRLEEELAHVFAGLDSLLKEEAA